MLRTLSGPFDWRLERLDWPVTSEVGPGLAGAVACGTRVGWLEPTSGLLAYRGIPVERIVGWGITFEEVVHLLVTGRRPEEDRASVAATRRRLVAGGSRLPEQVTRLLDELPAGAHPTRLLRAGVSALGCHELRASDELSGASHWRELRIVGQVAALVGEVGRRLLGADKLGAGSSIEGPADEGLAAAMLRALTGRAPTAEEVAALELLWVLYADHGLDAPSFTSIVVASCHADPYYNVVAGLSALLGERLGGATERVWQQLSALDGPQAAARWVDDTLAEGGVVAGFGHRMYRMPDPRAAVLHQAAARLARARGEGGLLEVAEVVHRHAARRLAARGVHININFYAAVLFDLLGAPAPLFPCLYAVGRMAGLVARVHEVLDGGRIFRPLARYRSDRRAEAAVVAPVPPKKTPPKKIPAVQTYRAGLEGLVFGETSVGEIDGQASELRYRGHRLDDLAARCSFEQVAYLVLHGALPTAAQLEAFRAELWRWRCPPAEALAAHERVPDDAHPLALLRTMFTVADCARADDHRAGAGGGWSPARVLGWSAALGAGAIRHLLGHCPLPIDAAALEAGAPGPDSSFADRFLYQALGALPADEADRRAFEVSLIVQAEHGLHAAALASLVVISTGADLGSAVLAGMGALSGARHGGANQLAYEQLEPLGSPGEARRWAAEQLARKARLPGFGHRVYKCPDPRVRVLEPHAEALLARRGRADRWRTYLALRGEIEATLSAKGIYANVDSITGLIYGPLGLPASAMSIPFCLAIQTGWMARCLEYRAAGGPMIEPAAVYLEDAAKE